MKAVFLQPIGSILKLTPVRTGKLNLFGAPVTFDLPEDLRDGRAFENIPGLALYAAKCIKNTEFKGWKVLFCLEDGPLVTKEFRHLPARRADLLKLAALEAKTVLKDDAEHYSVLLDEYGGPAEGEGPRLRSVLYAAPAALIRSIRQEFRSAGLKVARIVPTAAGLTSACRTALGIRPENPQFAGRAVAVVDAGFEKLRLVLLRDGYPIARKEFDSVCPDLLSILHRDGGVAPGECPRELMRPGFLLTAGLDRLGPAASESAARLLETAADEAVRNARVVLSSERLDLDRVLFCGALTSHPDFRTYIESLSLEIPFDLAENLLSGPDFTPDADAALNGCGAGDFLTLDGLLQDQNHNDFLYEENQRRGGMRISAAVVILTTAGALAAMSILPLLYSSALRQVDADRALLSSPAIVQIKELLDRQSALTGQISDLEADRKTLPAGLSDSAGIVGEVREEVLPNVVSIESCQIDNSVGSVSLGFTAADLDRFNAVRKSVAEAGYFTVLIPFSATRDADTGAYRCSTTLQVRDFRGYSPVSSAPEPASSGTSSGEEAFAP